MKKDLKESFHFKKSKYFDDEHIRDYVFKGYVAVTRLILKKKKYSYSVS